MLPNNRHAFNVILLMFDVVSAGCFVTVVSVDFYSESFSGRRVQSLCSAARSLFNRLGTE